MEIISTNIGRPTTIAWKGGTEETGIFKYPVNAPLFLGTTDVAGDTVSDRKHHAGTYKACYLFAADHYPYWRERYPHLTWDWGMFGENLTVKGLDESQLRVGDTYSLGTALVQITEPREPCYKLGIRFNDQEVVPQFVEHGHPGTYVRVLKEGEVKKGDVMQLQERSNGTFTISDFYQLLYQRPKPQDLLKRFMENEAIPQQKKDRFKKFLK
ncbi:MOSC domain-containing protein [Maribacter sp. 2307ULW6-5]|uniref:MOSC domain-containing protein n=1 Tax=Maribacter sp. 2307ULW6-5 TaxID=3386275 RepID=UPI0039BD318E